MKEHIRSPTKNINGDLCKHHIFFLHNQKLLKLTISTKNNKGKEELKNKNKMNYCCRLINTLHHSLSQEKF